MSCDSKICLAILFVSSLGLQACVTGGGTETMLVSEALSSHGDAQFPHLQAFRTICLSGDKTPTAWYSLAISSGWEESSTEHLAAAGLEGLKKQVLSIPGGGGRFDEEQILLSKAGADEIVTAAFERRYVEDTNLSSTCQIFSKSEFLSGCEALGKAVGRAPDHNQRYPARDAHFIRWDLQMDGLPATLSCERAPNSPTLGYSGTVLRLSIDHTVPARKPAASRPDAVVSER